MKKLIIKDIARIAGVSKSTISKVINDYGDISNKTKQRIKKIIEKYNYHPLDSAQILGKRKSDIIAFVTSRITAHFTAGVLWAIENRARELGEYTHNIVPYSTFYDRKIATDLFKKLLYGKKIAALIALAMDPAHDIILQYKKAKIPVVLIENKMKNAHCVNIDNYKGGFLATKHLIERGRKKIGLICGNPFKTKYGFDYTAVQRRAGFINALKHHGRKFDKKYQEISLGYSVEDGVNIFNKFFFQKKLKLDAIFCAAGDMCALGIMQGAKKYGMKIPDDLALVGYDDQFYTAYLFPPLTTIRQPFDKLGTSVFNITLDAIQGVIKDFKHIEIEPELIIRKST